MLGVAGCVAPTTPELRAAGPTTTRVYSMGYEELARCFVENYDTRYLHVVFDVQTYPEAKSAQLMSTGNFIEIQQRPDGSSTVSGYGPTMFHGGAFETFDACQAKRTVAPADRIASEMKS